AHLLTNSFVTLVDTNGLVALTVQAASPLSWPNLFGVVAQQNTVNPANFDLSVVYNPTGGASGVTSPVTLETFPNLPDAASAMTQINTYSKFVQASNPVGTPTSFPANPTMLVNGGSIDLKDAGGTAYLTVEATNPATWPPSFGVLTQDDISSPSK